MKSQQHKIAARLGLTRTRKMSVMPGFRGLRAGSEWRQHRFPAAQSHLSIVTNTSTPAAPASLPDAGLDLPQIDQPHT